jgi:hypothetical protein
VETGLVIKNFVELVEWVKPFYHESVRLSELTKFSTELESACCDKMSLINRCVNYYVKLPETLTPDEKQLLLTKNNGKSIVFLYQSNILWTLDKSITHS